MRAHLRRFLIFSDFESYIVPLIMLPIIVEIRLKFINYINKYYYIKKIFRMFFFYGEKYILLSEILFSIKNILLNSYFKY